jgi:hypothetical protein
MRCPPLHAGLWPNKSTASFSRKEPRRFFLARFLAVLARLLSILENSVKDGRADPATSNGGGGGDDRTSCAGEGESTTAVEVTTVQSRRGTREVSWLG